MPSSPLDAPQRAAKRARGDGSGHNSFAAEPPVYSGFDAESPAPGPFTASAATHMRVPAPKDDFSSVVKSKLLSYTRTGQACDRCKVRKIRCDALPEGCSHCLSQQLECYVTDRITGRTERRGYLQELEREKAAMTSHIQQLQTLLQGKGVEVFPWHWSPYARFYPPDAVLDNNGNVVQDGATRPWKCLGSVWYRTPVASDASTSNSSTRSSTNKGTGVSTGNSSTSNGSVAAAAATSVAAPADTDRKSLHETTTDASPPSDLFFDSPQSGPIDSYLGVFADRAPLNSVNGTQVSILGTLLDIDADGSSGADGLELDRKAEPENPGAIYQEPVGLYNRSLGSFLRSSMNINPPLTNVELPSRSDAFEYSEWYFLMVNPFAPVLHKPSYMTLLTRIYDDPKFRPTTSELVIVHMVFAAIYFQYGVRNREELTRQIHLHNLSNKHYHWALSKFYYLASDCSITAVQALVLIALYTRAFPKPSCGSTIANYALMKAIDLGLHRRVPVSSSGNNTNNNNNNNKKKNTDTPATSLSDEIRKRVWWSALMLSITLNGRLGRPMPIGREDFDTELPVAIADEYLTEDGITEPSQIGRNCLFLVSLHGFQFTPLYMDMFRHLYSARRDPRRYAALVRDLEAQYRAIQDALPADLHVASCKPAYQMYALYAQAMSLEFCLCLRHPSVCMTTDPQVFAENTRLCEATARTLLRHVQKLLTLKSLDTTWYQLSVYCAAMFSMLAAAWERRRQATAADLALLQNETSIWLSIIAEIGLLVGAADAAQPFNRKLTQICARTIFCIQRDMPPLADKTPRPTSVQDHGHGHGHGPVRNPEIGDPNGDANGGRRSSSSVDSMARHLEDQARQQLESRMEHEQGSQLVPPAAAQSDPSNPSNPSNPNNVSNARDPQVHAYVATNDGRAVAPPAADTAPASYQPAPAYAPVGFGSNNNGYVQPHPYQQPHHLHEHLDTSMQQPQFSPYDVVPSSNAADAANRSSADGGNPWTNWTAAVAGSQSHDRFTSADALLDLRMLHARLAPPTALGMPGETAEEVQAVAAAEASLLGGASIGVGRVVGGVAGGVAGVGGGGPFGQVSPADLGSHSAQWPLLLFNEHAATGV
ncbi:c6 zinc finger domain containing protein [Niveomyces insectorum RCEF 264]|uniref:C6 zinc finger domain containing protein n=1 Tax=Niveomyces insectorum RCEF 264 TaxID=1081102 RepID=A0A167N8M6_9HYPO|nr:c6 zinc finger domain containing protein [Niveomyces insectorum RCEF 264]